MQVKTYGATVYGVDAIMVTVEVDVSTGLNYFIVGLPDNAVKESMLRIESAIKSIGLNMPRTKIVVNLAPADIKKSGTAFDLPIAIGILAASGQIKNSEKIANYVIMGELGLQGKIRPINGALPISIKSRSEKLECFILPKENANEAAIVNQIEIIGVEDLKQLVDFLNKEINIPKTIINTREEFFNDIEKFDIDFEDVRGQENIKRALEISAAGSHNVILIGPPGSGKTMLSKRIATILPPLTLQESLETTKVHSVSGKLQNHAKLISSRPFRSPHHTISEVALVGGGSIPQPGEISLAHNGVLFLDELPEFKRTALEVMRQPMEDKKVEISRTRVSLNFPCNFMLIAAMNPCPCGYYNHPGKKCTCSPQVIQKYLNKISGPLLDRIDLHIEVKPVIIDELTSITKNEKSVDIRKRVLNARNIQIERYKNTQSRIHSNSQITKELLNRYCRLDNFSINLIKTAMERLNLSARAYDRIIKVARTIADLGTSENIKPEHVAEAIQYRSLDRENWGK